MTDHTKQPLDLLTRLRMSYAGKYSPLQVEAADAIEALIAERDALQGENERLNRESRNLSNQLGDCDRARLALQAKLKAYGIGGTP